MLRLQQLTLLAVGVTASGNGATKTITIAGGGNTLNLLADVDTTGIANDKNLKYNSISEIVNQPQSMMNVAGSPIRDLSCYR